MIINHRYKAHRRLFKRALRNQGVSRSVKNAMKKNRNRSRILGAHWRWMALGEWRLKHGSRPLEDVLRFLSAYDFAGFDYAR